MKKLFLFSIIALFFSATVGCEKDEIKKTTRKYFYYYKGKKQYLELNTHYIFILSKVKELPKKYSNYFGQNTEFKREDEWDKIQPQTKTYNFYWSKVRIIEDLSEKEYLKLIENIKKEKNVETVAPYFQTKDTPMLGLTNFFTVKLKKASDIEILKQQAKKYSCIVVEQDKFMPLWFVLSVTKQSNKDALQLSNLFYESGLFKYAEPDIMGGYYLCK